MLGPPAASAVPIWCACSDHNFISKLIRRRRDGVDHGIGWVEFERALLWERQREGVALAKQHGVYRGRKKTLSPEVGAQDPPTGPGRRGKDLTGPRANA